jgi:integrase
MHMARGRTYRKRKADGTWSRWYAVIDGPKTSDGRRRQVTRTFDTQREAHAWLASGSAGGAESDSAAYLDDWLHQWLSDQPFTKPSTLATYRCHVDRHLSPALGRVRLEDLNRSHIAGFVRDLAVSVAPATVHRVVATLRSALGAAQREGRIASNPVHGIRLPSVPARPHRVWTVEQTRDFLASCSNDAIGVLFRLAVVSGMRRGELLGLEWSSVDLKAGELTVRASRVAVGGEIVQGTPKSRFGVRTIYLDHETCLALNAWRWTQARCIGPNDGLVFTHVTGTPFQPWWVSRAFDRRVEDLGLPRIRFHDLRHTSATIGLAAGESLKEVSARLGHADIAITANVYGEVLPQTAQASSERRARMLAGKPVLVEVAS